MSETSNQQFSVIFADVQTGFQNLAQITTREFPGCAVESCSSRAELLSLVSARQPDLIVISNEIANQTASEGEELLATVRHIWTSEQQRRINIIVISSAPSWNYLGKLNSLKGDDPRRFAWMQRSTCHLNIVNAIKHTMNPATTEPWIEFKVLIVDDHELYRKGLEAKLANKQWFPAFLESRSQSTFSLQDDLIKFKPDIIYLDIQLANLRAHNLNPGNLDGLDIASTIWERKEGGCLYPVPIIIVSGHTGPAYAKRFKDLLPTGEMPCGWLRKETGGENVMTVTRQVLRGQPALEEVAAYLTWNEKFDWRESENKKRETLAYVAIGLSDIEIARLSGVTDRAIQARLTQLYKALNLAVPLAPDATDRNSRSKATWQAIKFGILTPAELLKFEAKAKYISDLQARCEEILERCIHNLRERKQKELLLCIDSLVQLLSSPEHQLQFLQTEQKRSENLDGDEDPFVWPGRLVDLLRGADFEKERELIEQVIQSVLIIAEDSKHKRLPVLEPQNWTMPKDTERAMVTVYVLGAWLLFMGASDEETDGAEGDGKPSARELQQFGTNLLTWLIQHAPKKDNQSEKEKRLVAEAEGLLTIFRVPV